MIPKPESCKGCPFEKLSQWYTPDTRVPGATVGILGQAPGEHEEQGKRLDDRFSYSKTETYTTVQPQPLIGASGRWLRSEWWPKTRLDYTKVSKFNVLKCRPYGKNDLPSVSNNVPVHGMTNVMLKEAIAHCTRAHLRLGSQMTYLIAMGEIALYALTGEELLQYKKYLEEDEDTGERKKRLSTVTEWRGSVVGVQKRDSKILGLHEYYDPIRDGSVLNIMPMIHLASLFGNEKYYEATQYDYIRFGKLVRGEWPSPLPSLTINSLPPSIPQYIGFDTEYKTLKVEGQREQTVLTMWSLAILRRKDEESHIYVVDATVSDRLSKLPERLTVVTQNGRVDYPHLLPLLPMGFHTRITLEDCMLGWAVTHAGSPTSLDYQLSIAGSYNRHKHLRESKEQEIGYLYAGLDAETTINDAWRFICQDFKNDPLLWEVYKRRRRPLIPLLAKSEERGIETHQPRIQLIKQLLGDRITAIEAEAKQLTGDEKFNIRSPGTDGMLGAYLYNRPRKVKPEKVKKPRKRKLQQVELEESNDT